MRNPCGEELVYADPLLEVERTTALRDLLLDNSPAQHDVALEILLSAALGKATVQVDDALREGLSAFDHDLTIAFFLNMLSMDAEERADRALGAAAVARRSEAAEERPAVSKAIDVESAT